ncbi:MAG: HEAT repeat domain-containing protein [Nitrospirae bacterium]|nr:HEAT repeat domain-containing protein [Nitrospirota bacterium]
MVCKDWDDYKTTNDLNLRDLKDVIKSGRAIAFIGAGCSMPLGYLSWDRLIKKMLDEIVRNEPSSKSTVEKHRGGSNLLYIAGKCKNLMGPKYYPFLGREFAPKTKAGKKHTQEHELIINLPFYNYMTSNYDSCLDSAHCLINNTPSPHFTYKNTQMLSEYCIATIEPQKKIFHIHGRYDDPQDIVLTEGDYKDHYLFQRGFISSLESIIKTRPVVFIGSGVTDLDFLSIMRFIESVFKGFHERHYAIIPYPENDSVEYEAEMLADTYNITPVFYETPAGSHARREAILRDILSYCNAATPSAPAPVAISATSQEHELEQYKVKLNAELTNLRILDMSRPLNLLDIYIKICLREKVGIYIQETDDVYGSLHEGGATPQEMPISRFKTEPVSRSMSIDEALRDQKYNKRLVILGDPGAGKTTMLKHITLKMATDDVEGIKGIPIFVTLRDYVNKSKPDLLDYLDDDLSRRYGFNHARTYLEEEFKSGNVAIFFDGLDEVSGGNQDEVSANYTKAVEAINSIATRFPGCYIAVTCRKAGWKWGINSSFSIFEVLDFTSEDITNFVGKWFRGEPEKAKALNSELARRTRVKSLAGNPLLLSFVCILYGKYETLPERRVSLYEKCVEVLLNDWDETRDIKRRNRFTQDNKKLLLQYIAYRFFIEGKRYFTKKELLSAIQEILPDLYLKPEDAEDILKEISASHGLLKKQADGWYGFLHLTIQEYFAACAMYEGRRYNIAIENSFKPWWEEVILLLAGIGDSTELIKGLFEKPDDIFDHNLMLAGRCLAEKPTLKGGGKLREAVLNKLRGFVVSAGKYWLNKVNAIDVLAENGEIDFLLALLREEKTDNHVGRRIAEALGKIEDSSIAADLMPILLDKKTGNFVRRNIAEALRNLGDSSIVAKLMPVLLDEKTDYIVRTFIALALSNLGDSSIVADLMSILRDEKTHNDLRSSIVFALGNLGDSSIVADLVSILRDDKTDTDVRTFIAEALGNLGDSSIVVELMSILCDEKTHNDLRSNIVFALGNLGDSSIVVELMSILCDAKTDNDLRCSIAEALGNLGDARIVAELMPILRDAKTDNDLRCSIAEALGNLGDARIVAELMPILHDKKTDKFVRCSIASALGKIGDLSIVAELISMIGDVRSAYIIWDNIVQTISRLGNTKEHCKGLFKLRSKTIDSVTLHEALYQVSRRAGVVIYQDGRIIEA